MMSSGSTGDAVLVPRRPPGRGHPDRHVHARARVGGRRRVGRRDSGHQPVSSTRPRSIPRLVPSPGWAAVSSSASARAASWNPGRPRKDLQRLVREVAGRRPWFLRGDPVHPRPARRPVAPRRNRAAHPFRRRILSRGETLTVVRRAMIEQAFRCRVADHYATNEVAHVAQSCPDGSGRPARPRATGSSCTSSGRTAAPRRPGERGARAPRRTSRTTVMPFINYAVGDLRRGRPALRVRPGPPGAGGAGRPRGRGHPASGGRRDLHVHRGLVSCAGECDVRHAPGVPGRADGASTAWRSGWSTTPEFTRAGRRARSGRASRRSSAPASRSRSREVDEIPRGAVGKAARGQDGGAPA